MSKHIIISGTGRAGTTFLVQLLTELGIDTGFADSRQHVYPECDAGMEVALCDGAPYVVKSPHLCMTLGSILERDPDIVVEHAIVPFRSLHGAAESRRDVVRRNEAPDPERIAGGLWGTAEGAEQEAVLASHTYSLLLTLAQHEIPVTLLHFPRIVVDPDYLYRHLRPLFPMTQEGFCDAFAAVSRPELVHDFER